MHWISYCTVDLVKWIRYEYYCWPFQDHSKDHCAETINQNIMMNPAGTETADRPTTCFVEYGTFNRNEIDDTENLVMVVLSEKNTILGLVPHLLRPHKVGSLSWQVLIVSTIRHVSCFSQNKRTAKEPILEFLKSLASTGAASPSAMVTCASASSKPWRTAIVKSPQRISSKGLEALPSR